jgi:hypothetical protein
VPLIPVAQEAGLREKLTEAQEAFARALKKNDALERKKSDALLGGTEEQKLLQATVHVCSFMLYVLASFSLLRTEP